MISPNTDDWTCPTCVAAGRRGYCCAGRCYCGHPSCHAFASFVDTALPAVDA